MFNRFKRWLLAVLGFMAVGVSTFLAIQRAEQLTGINLTCDDVDGLMATTAFDRSGLNPAIYKMLLPPACRSQVERHIKCWAIGGDPNSLCRYGLIYDADRGGVNTDGTRAVCTPNASVDKPFPCGSEFGEGWIDDVRMADNIDPNTAAGNFARQKIIELMRRKVADLDR